MARFIAFVQGQAGEASRLGSPRSGISAHVRGWNAGVVVHGRADDDADVFDVYSDGGSNGGAPRRHLGTLRLDDKGRPEFTLANAFRVDMDGGSPIVKIGGE